MAGRSKTAGCSRDKEAVFGLVRSVDHPCYHLGCRNTACGGPLLCFMKPSAPRRSSCKLIHTAIHYVTRVSTNIWLRSWR